MASFLELSVDDEIDEVDLRLRRTPADRRALDRSVAQESLVHRHAHHAPFERTVDDPGPNFVDIDMSAACRLVSGEQIRKVAEATDDLFRLSETPGIRADPADVLERIADMRQ